MNIRKQTDAWIHRVVLALVLMLAASAAGILARTLTNQPVPELLYVLGAVAGTGLARLLAPSPWRFE
jgi:phosphate/sulfate permease